MSDVRYVRERACPEHGRFGPHAAPGNHNDPAAKCTHADVQVLSDAVVVCRGPDGQWPGWAVWAIDGALSESKAAPRFPHRSVLDALAEASRKETE